MLARDLKSALIIMSSVAGCYEHPGASAYSASKAITNFFGRSLSHEVKEKIDLMVYAPAMTSTPMLPLDVGAMGAAVTCERTPPITRSRSPRPSFAGFCRIKEEDLQTPTAHA